MCVQVDLFFYREPEETKKEEEEEVPAIADYGVTDYTAAGLPGDQWGASIPDAQWTPDVAAAPPVVPVAGVSDWDAAPQGKSVFHVSGLVLCTYLKDGCLLMKMSTN